MNYPSIRIEGAILSPDILERLDDAVGQQPSDFGLEPSTKVKDEIARAWADAQDYWRIFQRKLESLKAESLATTETRNNWIVPLLGLLGYQLEYQARGTELNDKNYPISHRVTNRGQTPVHIIGCRELSGLDRKPEKSALRMSAHAMVQEYLNLTEQLFGLVTNGRVLRLMRDSSRLIKLSYLEFDLDRIFADGLFADFAVLYRLLHASRLPQSTEVTSSCWLERYHQDTIEQGTRIRDGLRAAVTEALELLGTGFISDPHNNALRHQIETKQLAAEDFFKHILRLVYRLLFLMVTEERGLVFPKGTPTKHVKIYFQHYSVQRLRRLALTRGLKIERCHDAWLSLLSTFRLFEHPDTAAKLSMTALVGQLFHPESLGSLAGCRLSNAALFNALDRLCNFNHPKSGQRIPVNFGALATEEFGSVYESLLELHPIVEVQPTPFFRFKQAAGNERKTTGSYYTPSSLVDCLLESALDPVLDDRIRDFAKLGYESVEASILSLKVCDPACGSGHFLIAAAQRIARQLARARSGDEEPSPQGMRHALRDVIGHCIYGVDINSMSVELCKVALWMEAMEPGKPLSFLDHHIQCGNSLLGTTPVLLAKGIPDNAFAPVDGDVKTRVTSLKKQNKSERPTETGKRQRLLGVVPLELGNFAADFVRLNTAPDSTLAEVAALQQQYARLVHSNEYESTRLLADTWCAAFVWIKDDSDLGKLCPTERDFRKVESQAGTGLVPQVRDEVIRLRDQYQFFHWHLAFPDVFRLPGKDAKPENEQTGWNGGFDVMLGNPPWESSDLMKVEFYATLLPSVAAARTTDDRTKLIAQAVKDDPELDGLWNAAVRVNEGASHVVKNSGLYPFTSGGKLNTYRSFAESFSFLVRNRGHVGVVLKSGIVNAQDNQAFFADLLRHDRVVTVFDFINTSGIFPDVVGNERFCIFVIKGKDGGAARATFMFGLDKIDQLHDESRRIVVATEDLAALNPNDLSVPPLTSSRDQAILLSVHRRIPVLVNEATQLNPHSVRYARGHLNSSTDSGLFAENTYESLREIGLINERGLWDENQVRPLNEGKLIGLFNHRFGTFEGVSRKTRFGKKAEARDPTLIELQDPSFRAMPRFWLRTSATLELLAAKRYELGWVLTFRHVCRAFVDARTAQLCISPNEPTSDSCALLLLDSSPSDAAMSACSIVGSWSSFVGDYVLRQKIYGPALTKAISLQLPTPTIGTWTECRIPGVDPAFLINHMLELTYTAWDLEPFARDCGYAGPPFRWDEERRFLLRAELDAASFHLYGINREDAAYILDTFPIVRRKDEARYNGEYKTKSIILEIYDALSEAVRNGQPYQSRLDPPPADPRVAHPDTRTSAGLSEEQVVQSGRIAAYVVLLLREWNRPAARNVLEVAIVLMLNDRVRAQILQQVPNSNLPNASHSPTEFVRGFDGFLAQLVVTGLIAIVSTHETQSIQLGTNVPATAAAPDEDRIRLQETLRALEIVGEDRAREVLQDMVADSYAIVS
jgi:N-6 DNA Methylase